jgi:hypothetical protein
MVNKGARQPLHPRKLQRNIVDMKASRSKFDIISEIDYIETRI